MFSCLLLKISYRNYAPPCLSPPLLPWCTTLLLQVLQYRGIPFKPKRQGLLNSSGLNEGIVEGTNFKTSVFPLQYESALERSVRTGFTGAQRRRGCVLLLVSHAGLAAYRCALPSITTTVHHSAPPPARREPCGSEKGGCLPVHAHPRLWPPVQSDALRHMEERHRLRRGRLCRSGLVCIREQDWVGTEQDYRCLPAALDIGDRGMPVIFTSTRVKISFLSSQHHVSRCCCGLVVPQR